MNRGGNGFGEVGRSDFRLLLRSNWELWCSGLLCND